MSDLNSSNQSGINRKQIILIAVLGTIFAGVLIFGQNGSESTDLAAESTDAGSVRRTGRTPSNVPSEPLRTVRWPTVELEDILRQNPFQSREELVVKEEIPVPKALVVESPPVPTDVTEKAAEVDAERREKMAALISEFQTAKVKMILRNGKQATAMIGERVIREGQVIDGVKIVSIRSDGVIIEPILNDLPNP